MTWVPQACTLPTAEQPLRVSEFDDLFAAALTAVSRPQPGLLRLVLSATGDVEATVRDLVARETECCSFFEFAIGQHETGDVLIDVRVADGREFVLDALGERAAHAMRGRP